MSKKYSDERLVKLRAVMQTQEYKDKISKAMLKRWQTKEHKEKMKKFFDSDKYHMTQSTLIKNSEKHKVARSIMSDASKKMWSNETKKAEHIAKIKNTWKNQELRNKLSIKHKNRFLNGAVIAHPKINIHIYNNIKFKHSWEPRVAKWLDDNNIKWEYESQKCRFKLPNNRTYIIDFYLPELMQYVEVKGWWTDYSRYKFEEAIKFGKDVRIVDKRNINNISLNITELPQ